MKKLTRNLCMVGAAGLLGYAIISGLMPGEAFVKDSSKINVAISNNPKESIHPEKTSVSSTSVSTAKLQESKIKWNQLAPSNGNISQAHRSLATETIAELQCSSELMELIDSLKKSGRWDIETTFNAAMQDILLSERAPQLRQSLAILAKNNFGAYKDRILKWSYFAGIGCYKDELKTFCESISNPAVFQEATFGWALSLTKTDPLAATTETWKQMENQLSTPERGAILKRIMKALPDGTSFSKIDAILPPDGQVQYGNVSGARTELFVKWGASDPSGAASYIINNPGRLKPNNLTSVVAHLAQSDPHTAVAWIQQFPVGAYFDAAANGTLVFIASKYPDEARQLAEMIQDPEKKRENLAMISGKLARMRRQQTN